MRRFLTAVVLLGVFVLFVIFALGSAVTLFGI
jgi:hypothetical protein